MTVMIFALFKSNDETFATTLSTDIPGTECKNVEYVAVPKNPNPTPTVEISTSGRLPV